MRIKNMVGLLVFLAVLTMPAVGQSVEVGAGYTFRPITFTAENSPGSNSSTKLTMNGWNASVGYNFNGFLGVVTDFDMTRRTEPSTSAFVGTNDYYSLLVGPQIYPLGHHKLTPYAHFEVGLGDFETIIPSADIDGGCGTFTSGPCNFTTASFDWAVGGGLQVSLSKAIALKLPEVDFERSGFYEAGVASGVDNQNHYEVKAGVLIRFGWK